MTIEVINGSATLDGTEQAIGSTTAFHPRASVYLPALVGATNIAAAKKSVWRIYSISDGVTSLLASGIWTDPSLNTVLLANVPSQGATVKLTVQAASGAGAVVAGSLVGWDQGDQITPATAFANGSITLTNAEQDVCALAAAYTLQNVTVNPNSDPLADRSIWRLYAVVNSVRYQIGSGRIRKSNLLQQALIDNVVTGAQSYVLTAQGGLGNSAVSVTGVVFGSSDSTTGSGGGGGGGLPAAGDVIVNPGDATKNDVVTITGSTSDGGVRVTATSFLSATSLNWYVHNSTTPIQVLQLNAAASDYIALGARTTTGTAYASAGLFRFGDLRGAQVSIMLGRNGTNTGDIDTISTDGSGNITFGGGFIVSQLGNTTNCVVASLNVQSGSFQAGNNTLTSFVIPKFTALSVAGAYTFTSDSNLTGWDFSLNGGNSLLGIRANWNIGDVTVAGHINFNGTIISLQAGASVGATLSANKFSTVRGITRNVRTVSASGSLSTGDDIVEVTVTALTMTLPTPSGVGDKYSIGFAVAGTALTLTVSGGGINILSAGVSAATFGPITSNLSLNQMTTFSYNGTLWVSSPGY